MKLLTFFLAMCYISEKFLFICFYAGFDNDNTMGSYFSGQIMFCYFSFDEKKEYIFRVLMKIFQTYNLCSKQTKTIGRFVIKFLCVYDKLKRENRKHNSSSIRKHFHEMLLQFMALPVYIIYVLLTYLLSHLYTKRPRDNPGGVTLMISFMAKPMVGRYTGWNPLKFWFKWCHKWHFTTLLWILDLFWLGT